MKDRVSANPNRYLITPEDGSPPFYGTLTRADNPIEEGTLLNKAAFLTDATESSIWGSAANRTVDAALKQLRSLVASAQSTASSALGKINIATGSYQGTANKDESSTWSKTLTLSIYPKLVVVKLRGVLSSFGSNYGNYNISAMSVAIGPDVIAIDYYQDSNNVYRTGVAGNSGTLSGRTLTIKHRHMNATGATYDYFAIG